MIAQIRDLERLGALPPQNVVAYLRARGWEKFSEAAGRFTVWHHSAHEDAEILVPVSRTSRDYIIQASETLVELERAEGRSQIDILRDLYNSGFDVIRIAAVSPSVSDGSVEIDAGVRLFESARDVLYAAACAAVRPQPVFYSRRPLEATAYMRKARLGQTEHGSYVLTLLSPVAPQLSIHSEQDLFSETPFERTVVETLARSVGFALGAAESAVAGADLTPFVDVVRQGVSANLCEGIVGLFDSVEPETIELSVSWALNRPAPNEVPGKLRISSDVVPTLFEAAHMFRAYDQLVGYTIRGPVVKLQRSGYGWNIATIIGRIEGVARKVSVELQDTDYALAVEAHANFSSVEVTGTVMRMGRAFRLKNVERLSILPDGAIEDPLI